MDDDFFDELEETLILADLGMDTVNTLMEELRHRVMNRGLTTTDHVKFNLKLILNDMLNVGSDAELLEDYHGNNLMVVSSYWAIDFTCRRNPGLKVSEIVVEEG